MKQTQQQLLRCIEQQLDNLQSLNQMQFDYWLSELCDENDELISEKCNQQVLSEIEQDVYNNDV
ncbi:MAG: hypothetical protein EB115_12870 [Betaproteobacteria bacterium]|nr:hypothetical protein [bacterium]NDF92835.1 hypothetical protein [Betaproteobacteria bacterium]